MDLPDWLLPAQNPEGLAFGAGALALLYRLYRWLQRDRRESRAEGLEEKLRDELHKQLTDERERADRFANGRNEALAAQSRAEAARDVAQAQLAATQQRLDEVLRENLTLRAQLAERDHQDHD